MGHYPIKCIRCAKILSNDEVLFHTGNIITNMEAQLRGTQGTKERDERKTSSKNSFWDSEDEDDAVAGKKPKEKVKQLRGKMTLADLLEYTQSQKNGVCTPQYQHVELTPDYIGEEGTEGNEDLLVGVYFTPQEGGPTARAWDRYCPYCEMELPKRSGQMPTYNITLIGTTSSGKTVYLCALNAILSTARGGLPYRSCLSSVSGSGANNAIVTASTDMFTRGILPNTTQNLLNEPLVFEMTYQLQNYQKHCLFALTDMRGEDMVEVGGANLMTRGQFLSKSDGFLFIISPLNMTRILNLLPRNEGIAERQNPAIHQQLTSQISDYLLSFFENGKIETPCVAMLSKCDILKKYALNLNLPPYNAVIAKEAEFPYTKSYFKSQGKGVEEVLRFFDPSLNSFIHTYFPYSDYTSFSSLGSFAIVQGDGDRRAVQNVNAIYPCRVPDPIILLLMRLGFLPQFREMEVGPQNERKNRELLQNWIENYTTG